MKQETILICFKYINSSCWWLTVSEWRQELTIEFGIMGLGVISLVSDMTTHQPWETGVMSILQIRKLRLKEVKQFVQDHIHGRIRIWTQVCQTLIWNLLQTILQTQRFEDLNSRQNWKPSCSSNNFPQKSIWTNCFYFPWLSFSLTAHFLGHSNMYSSLVQWWLPFLRVWPQKNCLFFRIAMPQPVYEDACVHIYVYVWVCICVCTYECVDVLNVCLSICKYGCVCVGACDMSVYVSGCIFICDCVCVSVCVMCACVFISMCESLCICV